MMLVNRFHYSGIVVFEWVVGDFRWSVDQIKILQTTVEFEDVLVPQY